MNNDILAIVEYMVFYPDNHQGGSGEYVKHNCSFRFDGDKSVNDNIDNAFGSLRDYVDETTYHTTEKRFIPLSVKLCGFEILKKQQN